MTVPYEQTKPKPIDWSSLTPAGHRDIQAIQQIVDPILRAGGPPVSEYTPEGKYARPAITPEQRAGITALYPANIPPPPLRQTKAEKAYEKQYKTGGPGVDLIPQPSYQASVAAIMQPYINAEKLTARRQANMMLQPTAGVSQSLGETFANALTSASSDYQAGLSEMLKTLPNQQGLQAIIQGMKDVIAYPENVTAPPGIQGSPFLNQLYAVLAAMRLGQALPASASGVSTAGYGTSLTASALQP